MESSRPSRHQVTPPELAILEVLNSRLKRTARADDEIKCAVDYLRPHSSHRTFSDVQGWLRRHRNKESATATTPPRWGASLIARQLSFRPEQRGPEKQRSNRSAKHPMPPQEVPLPPPPQAMPIIPSNPPHLDQLPESDSPAIPGGNAMGGATHFVAVVRSLVRVAALEFHHEVETELMLTDALEHVLLGWLENDHHDTDRTARAQFAGKPASARISARIKARPAECANPPE
jgi:hypothetical protein